MGARKRPGQVETKPETHRYLSAADYFLRGRNFAECRRYALLARDSDPTHPGPARILAIATVLSAPAISPDRRDYYAVLDLPRLEPDAARVRSSFRALASSLNPNVNPYPLAAEALDLILRAWSVLSNPSEKAVLDEELRRNMPGGGGGDGDGGGGGTSGSDGGTFWTMCPYCYFVYEYEKVYENCSLRCSNERCRRVLHAVAIRAPLPPPAVVEKGQYLCAGFMPLGVCGGNGEEIGEKLWAPFDLSPQGSSTEGSKQNVACNGEEGVVVEVSDDGAENAETVETGFRYHANNRKRGKIEVEASDSGEMKGSSGERSINGNENENAHMENGVKDVRMRRKKSVPFNSKKMMGRGIVIENDSTVHENVNENMNVDENVGDPLGLGIGCEVSNGVDSGVEFFEGDDDVLIGLQYDFDFDFDFGNGDMSF